MSKIDEILARVRELDAAVTAEPWFVEGTAYVIGHPRGGRPNGEGLAKFDEYRAMRSTEECARDATLTAEYRTLAPKLEDMLERAMEELESVRVLFSFRILQDAADAIDEIEAMAEGGES